VSFRLPLFHVSWRRTVQGIAALFLTTIAIGGLYQTVSLFRERRAFPMPGRLVDVGGYKMHIYCTPQGSPAVILDSGLGDSFISWQNVQPQIASFVRVCSYDRAGLGKASMCATTGLLPQIKTEVKCIVEAERRVLAGRRVRGICSSQFDHEQSRGAPVCQLYKE
jgi:hypothetical protein